jgi:hypothetical protein
MKPVTSVAEISPGEREQLRLDFYRGHRGQSGFASVAVRRDAHGVWFLDVGATAPVDLPPTYRGLKVRTSRAAGAVNAVARPEQVV